jgi:hypothetical protein
VASYRVQLWDFASDYSTNQMIAEIHNPKNLAYGQYLNDIGEAFFTIAQRDLKANLEAYVGKAHVFIIRYDGTNEDVVWRGILSEHDANDIDVILYAYTYEHYLFSLHSPKKKKWKGTQIAGTVTRPMNYLWQHAKDEPNSPVQWITTGTIQSPWTDDNQDTAIVLNSYKVSWKPILTCFRELNAIALSDTGNISFFEIDFPTDPTDHSATFNYWKDNSTDVTDLKITYPNNVLDWSDRFTPVMLRNKTFAMGSGPRGQLYYYNYGIGQGDYGRIAFGMHSQNLYLSWVRDRAELSRVTKRRTNLARRENANLYVRLYPDSTPPYRATTATWELGDFFTVDVRHGATQINKLLLFIGEQVVFANGREYVQPMLEDRPEANPA